MSSPLLSARNISLDIEGRRILNDISFDVFPGEVVSLIGPNGAGKSTLLSVISGDVKPASGSVELAGSPLSSYKPLALARERAVLLQKMQVAFSYTVREVVAMGRTPWRGTGSAEEDERIIAESMQRTEVTHMADRDITTLSGGESGRAHLSRVFAQQTPLVLLDEPTAALDITHQEQTLVTSRALAAEGRGVLAVLHDLDVAAAYSNRIVLLRRGEIVAMGTPEEVCSSELLSEVYRHPIEVLKHPVTGRLLILPKR
ncbi:MAG: heme ABC transporter ATP-binding protein [Rothia sp. (in: high G+C Gram-positive bacteria)]|uniref:heme ABC transporter ATP-binding protein n=1 Tax=Rothia sp. (in: high G+C Gram-positive bacteria) TaxID=1885016 RepID=UPI0026E06FD8|nr:heme ABC transporter ATP-binding protein [Rothia sp. (in: high G+C Gram-positive bacteria)]MDO5750534.1 heme ABC transporter ATP-binding protein [Rothia sp. (in: high G+C Gram-positive bacteria)]